MGGGARVESYDDAVRATRTVAREAERAFSYSERMTRSGHGTVHPNLNPLGKVRECRDSKLMPRITPIIMGMDVTRSRGQDAKSVYSQLLPFLGALHLSGAVTDPQFLFAAFGDAKTDRAPLQIGQFESDERMDKDLEGMWLEEGGGGTGEESAELLAYYLARKTQVDAIDVRGQKGICFFTTDEAPYPFVSKDEVKRHIGDDLKKDIPVSKIFAELQKRYDTYLLYPGKPMAERQDDIDAEIRQRLLKAGGRFENCSIRASLIWNNYNDLDLHVITPTGEHIWYSDKRSRCGGELDVDRNAGGPQTREPVENIRWPKGTAKPGKYTVYVQNFATHERDRRDTPYKVELDIDGKIQTFEGVMKANTTRVDSDKVAFEFNYTPAAAVKATADSREAYTDEVILAKWRACIPDGHIIRLNDAKWTTEAAIGVMAIRNRVKTLDQVLADMHERAVDPAGIDAVGTALKAFAAQGVFQKVDDAVFT